MRVTASSKLTILVAGILTGCDAPQVDVSAETEAVRARSELVVAAEAR